MRATGAEQAQMATNAADSVPVDSGPAEPGPAVAARSLSQRWLDLSVRAKGLAVIAVPVLALVAVVVMSLSLNLQERSARVQGRSASGLVSAAQMALTDAVNAETGLRGYAATGDVMFLQPYDQAVTGLPTTLTTLDGAAQARGVLPQVKVATATLTAVLTDLAGTDHSVATGASRASLDGQLKTEKTAMDLLRGQVAAIGAQQAAIVARQQSHIDGIESTAKAVDIAGLVVGVLGGIAGIFLFGAGVARRVRKAAANAQRLGQGEPLETVPAARDELGELAISMTNTQELLVHRATELVAARDDALRASQSKTEFLSRTSHELRTPLNAMLGFTQLLELSDLDDLERDNVEHILKAGGHLVGLINDVLDIARIESREMSLSLEPLPLPGVTSEALALLRPLAAARSIIIKQQCSDASLAAIADVQRLKQVLLNLISNAIKYNRDGGTVTVACGADGAESVHVTVTDTGPGLTAAQLEKIYLPFERLGAEGSGVEGTGIGLTLSKALTETMGGQLEASSRPGEGASFVVRLPRAADIVIEVGRPQPVAAPVTTTSAPVAANRVLYIEDNLANIEVIQRLLANRADTDLFVALTGQLGIDLARQHHPTLILLDLHLPDMTGDDVLQCLRADPATANIQVVVLSADASPRSIRRLLAKGATGYLTKPLNLRDILHLLETGSPPAAVSAVAGGHAVLYVEDDADNVHLVESLLRRRPDVHLLVARTARSGLQLAIEEHPDLILLDRRLPDLPGEEVLQQLKASSQTAAIPVVMQSGDSGRVLLEQWQALGADDFLPKPYNRDDFYAVIDRYCTTPASGS